MSCDVSTCSNSDLADELLRRGADLILLPGREPDTVDVRFKTDPAEDNEHHEAVQILSAVIDVLQRLIAQQMAFAPECYRCEWRGFEHHEGNCPVCGNQLTEYVE